MTRFLCACGTSYDTHTATRVPYPWLLSRNTTFAIRPNKFSPEIRSTASIVGKGRKSFAIKTSGSFGNVYAAVIELADQTPNNAYIGIQLTAALILTGKRVQRVRRKMLFAIGIYL